MILHAHAAVLNFFFLGDVMWSHSINCCLDFCSKWWTWISYPPPPPSDNLWPKNPHLLYHVNTVHQPSGWCMALRQTKGDYSFVCHEVLILLFSIFNQSYPSFNIIHARTCFTVYCEQTFMNRSLFQVCFSLSATKNMLTAHCSKHKQFLLFHNQLCCCHLSSDRVLTTIKLSRMFNELTDIIITLKCNFFNNECQVTHITHNTSNIYKVSLSE
jgi:hypothetical protein